MANRGQTWDTQVHSIADLREHGSKKLPKMYRDYYNEGAMDLVTYVQLHHMPAFSLIVCLQTAG